jgi:membrane protein YqaA with SNARE-associated domain
VTAADSAHHAFIQAAGVNIWHPLAGSALLGLHLVDSRTKGTPGRAILAYAYPLAVALTAMVLTLSMTVPVASLLITAILLRRERWKEIVILSSLGSAVGGVGLYLIFHHLGWSQIVAAYPDVLQSKAWSNATRWVSAYGTLALLGIAATPVPQTPALIFTAISRLPIEQVFVALLVGKLVKYGIYGFLAVRCPTWFGHVLSGHCQKTLSAKRA